MRKTVSPAAAIAVIVVVVVIAVFLFSRAARTQRKQFVPGVGVIDSSGKPVAGPGRRGGAARGGGGQTAPARR